VASWPDASGNGHTATASGAAEPTYKVNVINSLPVVRFASGTTSMATAAFTLNSPSSVFLVATVANTGSDYYTDGLGVLTRAIQSNGGSALYVYTNGGGNAFSYGVASTTSPSIVGSLFNGASSLIEWNGTTTTGTLGSGAASGLTVGSAGATPGDFVGDIGEVIVYSSAVDTNLRQCIEGYLAWTWGLQGSLPSGHPYKSAAPTTASNCT
jgi:hypothetical protein